MPHDKHQFRQPEQITPEGFIEKIAYWFVAAAIVSIISLCAGYARGSELMTYDEVEAACEHWSLPCRAVDGNTIELDGVRYVRG